MVMWLTGLLIEGCLFQFVTLTEAYKICPLVSQIKLAAHKIYLK